MLKVFGSISANTGIKFHWRIAEAQAHIVIVGSITSSPGFRSKAPIAQLNPEDQELTVITYLTPKYLDKFFSNFLTYLPP